jgi:hypothetical protein
MLSAVHCYLVPLIQLNPQERTRSVASLTNICVCEVMKQLSNTKKMRGSPCDHSSEYKPLLCMLTCSQTLWRWAELLQACSELWIGVCPQHVQLHMRVLALTCLYAIHHHHHWHNAQVAVSERQVATILLLY